MVSKTAVCTALAPVAVGLLTLWWKNRQKKIPGEIKTEKSHSKKDGPNAEKVPDDDLVTDESLPTPHIGENLQEEPEVLTDFHMSDATSTSASVCGLQCQHTDSHFRKTTSTAESRSHDQHGQDSYPFSSSSVSQIDSLQEDAKVITDDQVNNPTQNNSTSRSNKIKTEKSQSKKGGLNAEKIPDNDLVMDGSLPTPHIGQNLQEEPEVLTDFHMSDATSTSASVCGLQCQHTDSHICKTTSTAENRSHDQHGQDSHPFSSSSVSQIDSLQEDAEVITDDQVNNPIQNNSTSRSNSFHDAVILHADDDRELAKRLKADLQQKTSLDNTDVVLYEEFAPDIGSHFQTISAIADRSSYLLVLVTPNFTQTTLQMFQHEIALMDSIESRSERIIPVWGSNDAQSLLLELSVLQGIDYHAYLKDPGCQLSFFNSMRQVFLIGRKKHRLHK